MIYKKNDKIVKTPQFARLVNYFEGLNQEWDEVNVSSIREYPTLTPEIGLEIPFTITVDSACLNTQFYFGSPPKMLHQFDFGRRHGQYSAPLGVCK